MKLLKLIFPVLFVAFIVLMGAVYILPEGRQAIITQFGKPIGNPVTDAGLHFKKPFLQDVRYVDKRILSWDGYPSEIPTKDKKYIKVDTTARWRVVNALTFIQTVQNERGAKARLDAILDATTRDVISNHNLVEGVRNSNTLLERVEQKKIDGVEDEISGEIEKISVGRENLSTKIAELASEELVKFGIKLIDVQLKRISYEKSVETKVYERMISERQRIAQKIRSIGQGEKAKIEGRLQRDLKEIESNAYKKAEIIKGRADAKAINIYAKELGRDPEFYAFIRSLEAYKKSLTNNPKLILDSKGEFFKYLNR